MVVLAHQRANCVTPQISFVRFNCVCKQPGEGFGNSRSDLRRQLSLQRFLMVRPEKEKEKRDENGQQRKDNLEVMFRFWKVHPEVVAMDRCV